MFSLNTPFLREEFKLNCKVAPMYAVKVYWELAVWLDWFLTLGLDGVSGLTLRLFYPPGKGFKYPLKRSLLGPQSRLSLWEKINLLSLLGIETRYHGLQSPLINRTKHSETRRCIFGTTEYGPNTC
jgi:hypothetical protein